MSFFSERMKTVLKHRYGAQVARNGDILLPFWLPSFCDARGRHSPQLPLELLLQSPPQSCACARSLDPSLLYVSRTAYPMRELVIL